MDTLFPGRVSLFCFVLFSGPIGAALCPAVVAFSVVDAGSVGYLSPSHHFLANLRLPWEPGNEALPHRESKTSTLTCSTQVGFSGCRGKSTPLLNRDAVVKDVSPPEVLKMSDPVLDFLPDVCEDTYWKHVYGGMKTLSSQFSSIEELLAGF